MTKMLPIKLFAFAFIISSAVLPFSYAGESAPSGEGKPRSKPNATSSPRYEDGTKGAKPKPSLRKHATQKRLHSIDREEPEFEKH